MLNKQLKLNLIEKSVFMGFLISILCSFVNFQSRCDRIKQDVFRLHIVANSDSYEDQKLKLKVRDRILSKLKKQKLSSLRDTKEFVSGDLDTLKNIAKDEISSNVSEHDLKIEICKRNFNNREYKNLILPAGEYDSLNINIGEGRGENWWCVLFPPMCVGASEGKVEVDGLLPENEVELVENKDKYEVEFKIVEIVNRIHRLFRHDS